MRVALLLRMRMARVMRRRAKGAVGLAVVAVAVELVVLAHEQ
jgi:hypothetical protein